MPNRYIKESIRTSQTLDQLSPEAECLFFRLLTVACNFGRFDADPRVMLSACFPLRVHLLKPAQVQRWRDELAKIGTVVLYEARGRCYGQFVNWSHYQRMYEGCKARFPDPPSIPQPAGDSGKFRESPGTARGNFRETPALTPNVNPTLTPNEKEKEKGKEKGNGGGKNHFSLVREGKKLSYEEIQQEAELLAKHRR